MVRATSYNNKIMKILVTGAKGFVGKNLCAQLNNIKDGKARCYGELKISDVFEYDLDSTSEHLHMIFNQDFVGRIYIIRVEAYF